MKKIIFTTMLLLFSLHLVLAVPACCTQRNDGAICELAEPQDCAGQYLAGQSTCDFASACQTVTCIDDGSDGTGVCSPETTKQACEAAGGTPDTRNVTDIPVCQNICCTVGDTPRYVNSIQCDFLEQSAGILADRKDVSSQAQCVTNPNLVEWGACVLKHDDATSCEYTTSSRCSSFAGAIFNAGWLCTHPQIGTNYEKQHSKVCVPGKDEVYWQDDHGNTENIYSSDKTQSFNSGQILSKEDSCNPDSANIGSDSCGNCNRVLGSTCGLDSNGEAVCVDLGCKDAPATGGTTKDRNNLESWCVYETKVGGGLDTPGSTHLRYTCNEGVVSVESCDAGQQSAYRTSACIQEDVQGQNGQTYSQASCRPVSPLGCVQENHILGGQEGGSRDAAIRELTDTCNEYLECQLQTFNFGINEAGVFCAPSFPMGLTLNPDAEEKRANDAYCSIADYTCVKVMERKHHLDDFDCIAGCDCDKPSFSEKMNDICTSLGDCGASVNTQGNLSTRGYSASIGLTQAYLDSDRIAQAHVPIPDAYLSEKQLAGEADLLELVYVMNGKTYSLDALAQRIFWSNLANLQDYGTFIDNYEDELTNVALWDAIRRDVGVPGNWVQDQNKNINDVANIPIASSLSKDIKYNNNFWQSLIGRKVKPYPYTFDCQAWQAPAGGDDCHVCDEGPIPCSEYKCESLGRACKFIQENQDNPEVETCIAIDDDGKAPLIDPWPEVLEQGYSMQEIDPWIARLEYNGKCIPLNQDIPIGITTHEHAQCKIVFDRLPSGEETDYEDVQQDDYFQEGDNGYLEEHQRVLYLSEADAIFHKVLQELDEQDIQTAEEFDKLIEDINEKQNEYNLYVRCEDLYGDSDPTPYVINTCIDAGKIDISEPVIRAMSPGHNSYISFDSNEEPVTFYINEPATCKWDTTSGLTYDAMSNDMVCGTNWGAKTLNGWPCSATIDGLTEQENTIYVKCKDQPWEEDFGRPEKRNEDSRETAYTLKKYTDKISITSISPNQDFETGTYVTNIDLTVQTTGGGTQHRCFYSPEGFDSGMIELWETGQKGRHKQPQLGLIAGINTLYVQCVDELGDRTQSSVSLTITHDTGNPLISRVWRDFSTLYIITNEEAECKYSSTSCNFKWEEGQALGQGTRHSISVEEGKNYYLKCMDEFENIPHTCTMEVLIA